MTLSLLRKPPSEAPLRMFCMTCNGAATVACDDEQHEVVSLKRARAHEAGPFLDSLQRADEGLATLGDVLSTSLEQERAGLAAARARLLEATAGSAEVWEEAKQAAGMTGE